MSWGVPNTLPNSQKVPSSLDPEPRFRVYRGLGFMFRVYRGLGCRSRIYRGVGRV